MDFYELLVRPFNGRLMHWGELSEIGYVDVWRRLPMSWINRVIAMSGASKQSRPWPRRTLAAAKNSAQAAGRNSAKHLFELKRYDFDIVDDLGLRPSASIAPARQTQFRNSCWPASSICSVVRLRQRAELPEASSSKRARSLETSG